MVKPGQTEIFIAQLAAFLVGTNVARQHQYIGARSGPGTKWGWASGGGRTAAESSWVQ